MITEKTFKNTIKQVMEHNDYKPSWTTTVKCNEAKKWTPCDLIIRETLNNGGGSAKGFLGIDKKRCLNAYEYICAHKVELIDLDLINKEGWNNWGISLWSNYNFNEQEVE